MCTQEAMTVKIAGTGNNQGTIVKKGLEGFFT